LTIITGDALWSNKTLVSIVTTTQNQNLGTPPLFVGWGACQFVSSFLSKRDGDSWYDRQFLSLPANFVWFRFHTKWLVGCFDRLSETWLPFIIYTSLSSLSACPPSTSSYHKEAGDLSIYLLKLCVSIIKYVSNIFQSLQSKILANNARMVTS
jgi:hypothetical protein